MRLACFLPTLDGGGAQRAVLNLAQALQERGYEVDVVVGDARGALASAVPAGVRLVDLRCRRLRWALLLLARYLRTDRPDCLISTVNHANVVALLARSVAASPTKIVVRLSDTLSMKATGPRLVDHLTFTLARRLYGRADLVIAPSHGSAADAADVARLDLQAVPVMPSPLVPENLPALLSEPIEHPFFQPDQPPVILGVGRFVPDKDFSTAIRAFALVRKTRPARLMLLGEGPLRDELEQLARRCGVGEDVALPGFVDNPFKYMAAAGVYVLTCQNEGMPGTLVQALACGVPVVATDCPSGPREILQAGRLGTLVPMGDPVVLADAIVHALRRPRAPVAPEVWLPYRVDRAMERHAQVITAVVAPGGR